MMPCPNMRAASATPYRKISRLVTLALFLLATSLLGCASASVAPANASSYPSIAIYVGNG